MACRRRALRKSHLLPDDPLRIGLAPGTMARAYRRSRRPGRSNRNATASRPHLTIVFTALAVSREAQVRTGVSIKRSSRPYGPCGQQPSAWAASRSSRRRIPDQAQTILEPTTAMTGGGPLIPHGSTERWSRWCADCVSHRHRRGAECGPSQPHDPLAVLQGSSREGSGHVRSSDRHPHIHERDSRRLAACRYCRVPAACRRSPSPRTTLYAPFMS